MNAKHTPRPWRIEGRTPENAIIIRAESSWPALVPEFNEVVRDSEQEANARLIASAPELLEACKVMLAAASWNDRDKCWNIGPMAETEDGKITLLKAAISKAEGS